jgi:hypothetical protein
MEKRKQILIDSTLCEGGLRSSTGIASEISSSASRKLRAIRTQSAADGLPDSIAMLTCSSRRALACKGMVSSLRRLQERYPA